MTVPVCCSNGRGEDRFLNGTRVLVLGERCVLQWRTPSPFFYVKFSWLILRGGILPGRWERCVDDVFVVIKEDDMEHGLNKAS